MGHKALSLTFTLMGKTNPNHLVPGSQITVNSWGSYVSLDHVISAVHPTPMNNVTLPLRAHHVKRAKFQPKLI